LVLTGGEPLLRPGLIGQIVEAAHAAGTKVSVSTGLYFANSKGRIPTSLREALRALDHITVSLDTFHEREVPRTDVFATVAELIGLGADVSFQVVRTGADDPYLIDVTSAIRKRFGDEVPALVAGLGSYGRAEKWLPRAAGEDHPPSLFGPCAVAGWPVVIFDGTVVTCCEQDVVDGPVPPHLRLGHAASETWAEVVEEMKQRAILRTIRTLGPQILVSESCGSVKHARYCSTCIFEAGRAEPLAAAAATVARPQFTLFEKQVEELQGGHGALTFAQRNGITKYADMVLLGSDRGGVG